MNNRTLARSAPTRHFRRLVLGTALLLALTVWLMPRSPVAFAQEAKPAAGAPTVAAPATPVPPAPHPPPARPR